ncbi:hypothetical protein INR49_010680 [Caranx melampygus]|nr:hypothetical protein INR49_010680 [Caranx melampygus]
MDRYIHVSCQMIVVQAAGRRTSRLQKAAKHNITTAMVKRKKEKKGCKVKEDEESRIESDGMQAWDSTLCAAPRVERSAFSAASGARVTVT